MNLKPPTNPNYAATVVKIRQIVPLDNCDNVVAAPLLGYQAIVSKDAMVGDLGVLFTAETQLSEEFARVNNLHRHGNLNDNPDADAKGYLEDNRRVKALKFRGHRSDALFMPLESLRYTGLSVLSLDEGDTFDELNGHEVCRKYVRPSSGRGPTSAKVIRPTRIDDVLFPKHFDTENYFKNIDKLNLNDYVYVTQKLHGTSIRVGHTLVARKLSVWEKIAQKFGAKIEKFEYDYVFGSRNVIKDANDPDQKHFYDSDIYTLEGRKLEGLLPKGYVLYGELIGWTPERAPIQAGYTYNIPEGHRELYVYRITIVTPDGRSTDLGWPQVKEFCRNNGLKHVPELWSSSFELFWAIEDHYLDKAFYEEFGSDVVKVDKGKVDEGFCIRRDGLRPFILKAKSPKFLQHETKMLDKGVEDMESEDGQEAEEGTT